jgi:pimeloyl-ACP methyl ester carboxylesterase
MTGQVLEAHVVLLVHGLDEPGGLWNSLVPELASRGLRAVRFSYPDDQALEDSSRLLLEAVEELHARGVQRLSIVAHSMGGLLTRDLLTRPDGYAGECLHPEDLPSVDRLITVGTPNSGSELAPFRVVLEINQRIARYRADPEATIRDLFRNDDGHGEAGRDLLPGSAFLTRLNSRPMPRGVQMTIIAAKWICPQSVWATDVLRARGVRHLLGEERTLVALREMSDLTDLIGDGVVPMESACLPGVEDVVLLEGDHRSLMQQRRILDIVRPYRAPSQEVPGAIPVIVERLTSPQDFTCP